MDQKTDEKVIHGTVVARLCYELDAPTCMENKDGTTYTASHATIGLLIFYRTGEAQVRLDMVPVSAFRKGVEYFIGNFLESEKIPEAPLIEGNLVAATDTRGDPVICGHIHSRQDEIGETQYYMRLYGIPVGLWRKAIAEEDPKRKSLYLRVKE